MTELTSLLLPVVLSAVAVFVLSSIIHMATPWHKGDFRKLPDEDRFAGAVRPLQIPPGDYMMPVPSSLADMKSPEFKKKHEDGPVMIFTMLPTGPISMGPYLAKWFVYSLVVSFFAAYVGSITLPHGTPYLKVFQVVGTVAFCSYSFALWPSTIWYRKSVATTIRLSIDGLLYGLFTAGIFGCCWPH